MTVTYEVLEVAGDVVRLTETFSGRWWLEPRAEEGSLRFLDPETLRHVLGQTGFSVERQHGDWTGSPLDESSAEIITVALRS